MRDSPPPGPDVRAIHDGLTRYRRTAADRWVPAGGSGPGFGWTEIPAAIRLDATGALLPGPDGALIMTVDRDGPAPSGPVADSTGQAVTAGGEDLVDELAATVGRYRP